MAEPLDVEYFHVVPTLPDELSQPVGDKLRVMLDILCRAAAHAIRSIGRQWHALAAQMGPFLTWSIRRECAGRKSNCRP